MPQLSDFVYPLIGVAVVGAFAVSEKVTDRTPPPGKIRVSYWEKWTGFEFDAMKAVVDDFNKSQDRIFRSEERRVGKEC